MSDRYVQRLRHIRDEFEAARQSLAYVYQNWDGKNLALDSLFQSVLKRSVHLSS